MRTPHVYFGAQKSFLRATYSFYKAKRCLQTTITSNATPLDSPSSPPPALPPQRQAERVLWLAPVWPERSSSAAGVRTADLIASFQRRGHEVTVAAAVAPNKHAEQLTASGVRTLTCPPNRAEALEHVLELVQPGVIVFDRFYAEEMYSFRVRELVPTALRVLDTQDIHFLREGRKVLAGKGASMEAVMACRPDATSSTCLRELSAIYRSDITLVCSPAELELLGNHYHVPAAKLALAPFFVPKSPHVSAPRPWAERQHIMMIGCFQHPPNADSVRWTVNAIWPILRKTLLAMQTQRQQQQQPQQQQQQQQDGAQAPELHIYGSYAPEWAMQMNNAAKGIFVKGFCQSLDVMTSYRLLLAPLRYGAGLKGKIVDAWWHGLPVVTTPVGAEGMRRSSLEKGSWGGVWDVMSDDPQEIADKAAQLYCNEMEWEVGQRCGFKLLSELYDQEERLRDVHAAIEAAVATTDERRKTKDFVSAMLWQQQHRATEYFSRWVELKEAIKRAAAE